MNQAARTDVRMVHDIEAAVSEEIGLKEQWDLTPPDHNELDDEAGLQRGEGEGPPQLSDEQLAFLDLVMSMIHNSAMTALDVKDALLVVDQKEKMYALIPTWLKIELRIGF